VTQTRKADLIFKNKDMENIFVLKDFPVFMGCMNDDGSNDLYEDFIVDISRASGVVQTRNLIDLDVLYDSEHSSGTVGKIWHDHHKSFANFINQRTSPSRVFEIGGLHGILSMYYAQLNKASWRILEPNPIPVEDCPAEFIKGFFDQSFVHEEEYDLYVHSHLFEHIYDPVSFAKKLSNFIPEGRDLIFSVPNIKEMLIRKYTNALNFEHTFLLNHELVMFLMESNGFSLQDFKNFKDDHSIFYHFKKDNEGVIAATNLENKYDENLKILKDWHKHHLSDATKIKNAINKCSREDKIFMFGAHIFSQTLLKFGLDENRISGILDNDVAKQGKRLYGTKLKVMSPNILESLENPAVILRAGVYNDEIKSQILNEINSTTSFI